MLKTEKIVALITVTVQLNNHMKNDKMEILIFLPKCCQSKKYRTSSTVPVHTLYEVHKKESFMINETLPTTSIYCTLTQLLYLCNNFALKAMSSEIRLKAVSYDRALLIGEERRFSANSARPLSSESPLKC
jgi:hypothetical protein